MVSGTSYSQTAVELEPGDLLLLYTDGINEARDESGSQLGLDSAAVAGQEAAPVHSAAAMPARRW